MFTPIILILAGKGADELFLKLRNFWLGVSIFLLPVGYCLFVLLQLVLTPATSFIPEADRTQYLNSWSAGFGVKEVREFLTRQNTDYPKVTIGVEGTFGLMPYALELYQKNYPGVVIKAYWPLPDNLPEELKLASKTGPVYFLVYQRQTIPKWTGQEVLSFRQGIGVDRLRLYEVTAK
jgi:hypothetical protein